LILDLEDLVPSRNKALAREVAARWLTVGHRSWVRINDAITDHWAEDLHMLADIGNVNGDVLAKQKLPNRSRPPRHVYPPAHRSWR
jgi:citrate lyase subunit beta/citryl-CoA lyase